MPFKNIYMSILYNCINNIILLNMICKPEQSLFFRGPGVSVCSGEVGEEGRGDDTLGKGLAVLSWQPMLDPSHLLGKAQFSHIHLWSQYWRQKQEDSWGSSTRQTSRVAEFQVQPETLSQQCPTILAHPLKSTETEGNMLASGTFVNCDPYPCPSVHSRPGQLHYTK